MSIRDTIEFDKELHSLYETKLPVSASKISALTKLAVKHAKHYKNIVFSIEKFVQKCPSELKLAGLYVIDSITRAVAKHPEEGEEYIARFEEKLDTLIPHLLQAPQKDKDRIKRTVGLWKKGSLFNVSLITDLEKKYFTEEAAGNGAVSDPRLATGGNIPGLNTPADPRLGGGAPAASINPAGSLGGLDASLLGALGSLGGQATIPGVDLGQMMQLLQAQQQQQQQQQANPLISQLLGLQNNSSLAGLAGLNAGSLDATQLATLSSLLGNSNANAQQINTDKQADFTGSQM
ncbi:uncharacterized protein EV422DRAFT_236473 [Fimicolochytrium jonesii]|uniref:uncharacterized protein n=1 Tax=Fimicolochytrium jonesii TaxID=1396493 RepID=UPI0022FE2286|nr:uncharacterized protein EV422DRAFT_236473 [Fimicolochytrium jonesii]KAI8824874.1 hypothetical protein EV422DRAFT_236473 [Fimicolochytrium jonesii]